MLTKDEFIRCILEGKLDSGPASSEAVFSAEDEFGSDSSDAAPDTRFQLLLERMFGPGQQTPRNTVIRNTDTVAKYIPDEVIFWPKAAGGPHHTLLIETSLDHETVVKLPPFKDRLEHLELVEDALARFVAATLDGFHSKANQGELRGDKHETLCVISIIDKRDGHSGRLVCFGTYNKDSEGLEMFFLAERARAWDRADAKTHLGLLYERFHKLGTAAWRDAFTTSAERDKAKVLLEVCTKKKVSEGSLQKSIIDLLDTIAKGFGLRPKPGVDCNVQAFPLPSENDIGTNPERADASNPFQGLAVHDAQNRLLGYIVYALKSKSDAERLSQTLRAHNRFHNVLVVYPDENQASLELWQGRDQLKGKLRKGHALADAATVVNLLANFFIVSRAKVRNPSELAQELAYRARYLRRRALVQLEDEREKGPLRDLYGAFKTALVHDQTEEDFADAFAQTITYGLLTARWLGNPQITDSGERFTRQSALKYLPKVSAFLNDLFKSVLSVKLAGNERGRLLWLVDDIASLLDRINVEYVFGPGDKDADAATDPVIHFYEPFLAAYDKELKNKRGVFFTPRPVVSYIVRSVHELLQTEFGLEDGLASTDTWGDVKRRIQTLQIPDNVTATTPFVKILDPATGTGTFLYECIDLIHRTKAAQWCTELGTSTVDPRIQRRWNDYVHKHLLHRLYGYEIMIASYAVSHLKIAFKLERTGYRFQPSDRINIYLTNSLEPPTHNADASAAGLFETFAAEASAVTKVKETQRFTAVIGNPPYSKISSNLSAEMRSIVERYRYVGANRIRERGALQFEINLQDDYVKFMRLCEIILTKSGAGVLGLITNNGYLSTPTLRGLRDSLLETFTMLRVLDLHGHLAKGDPSRPDENVFDITQGVAVLVAARRSTEPNGVRASVFHSECKGSREEKYHILLNGTIHPARNISPTDPFYLFVPHTDDLEQEWRKFVGLDDLFPRNSAGIITARDELVISATKSELEARMKEFSESRAAESSIYAKYGFSASKRFDLRAAQAELRKLRSFSDPIIPILHRPFDERYLFYHPSVVWSMSRPMATQMREGGNVALIATRQVTRSQFEHAFVARHIIEIKACSHDRNTQIFPLFIVKGDGELNLQEPVTPNLSPIALAALEQSTSIDPRNGAVLGFARDVFHYVYAILHSPNYRKRYFEFLRSEFPRIPLTPSARLFSELSEIGSHLVACHLLDSANGSARRYSGMEAPEVEKISYDGSTIWLDKKKISGFSPVSDSVWSFRIGGYQVCEKWLKDRRGTSLNSQGIAHYENVLVAIENTIMTMTEIDVIIDKHGGWFHAFAQKTSSP